MSLGISIVSENQDFILMAGDSRETCKKNDLWHILNDKVDKVQKINGNVIFGCGKKDYIDLVYDRIRIANAVKSDEIISAMSDACNGTGEGFSDSHFFVACFENSAPVIRTYNSDDGFKPDVCPLISNSIVYETIGSKSKEALLYLQEYFDNPRSPYWENGKNPVFYEKALVKLLCRLYDTLSDESMGGCLTVYKIGRSGTIETVVNRKRIKDKKGLRYYHHEAINQKRLTDAQTVGGRSYSGSSPRIHGEPIPDMPLSFPQTVAKSDLAAADLKQMINDNPLSYKPVNNPDTLKYAQDIVDQNFEAAKRIVKEGESFSNATESAMAQDVIRRLQNSKQWDEAFDVMEATARKAKTSGQAIQAFAMWRRMTPEGMLRYADNVFRKTGTKMTGEFADQLTDAMKRIDGIADGNQLRNAIMRQSGTMPEWAYKSMSKKTADQLKDIAMAQVLADIADQVPKSAWKKVSSIQAMSHLINIKTPVRNILGNITFGMAEKLSNTLATPFDAIGSLFTGRRTLTLPQYKGTFRKGFEQAREAAFDTALGIERTGISAGKYNMPTGGSFKGGIGAAGERILKYELGVPDEFFKGQVYQDVLQQQLKASGLSEPTQDMIDYATQRARYTTFQDNSLPAGICNGLKKLANMVGLGKKTPFFRVVGHQFYTHEFGLGDFLVKYTSVPGNLIARSLEYTPAGLLKILSIAKDANISGIVKQSEIAMTISRAITGTSMIAMGVALHRKGLLLSEDKERGVNAKSLDRAEGLGNYKVNISAVERMIRGEDTASQDGDILYSYNWLPPISVLLSVGAAIDDELQREGTLPEIVFSAGNAAMEEILDLPALSVIRQMTYQDNAFDVFTTPLVQGASGFIPSPVRQYAQMQDPTARLTKGFTPIGGAWNRVQSAIPGARESLEPKIDPFGREVTYPGGLFNAFINPGQSSTYRPSEVTPVLKQLEDITGQTDFYPRSSAPSYFENKGEKIYLTPEEKTLYMQIEGQEVLRRYKEILANGVTEKNAGALSKSLISAKNKASGMARTEILRQRE